MPLGLIFDVPNVYHDPNRFASQKFTGVQMSIAVEQLRAARALLGWSQRELAAKSRVSRNAIVKFEIGWSAMLPRTMEDLVEAFEEAGVILYQRRRQRGSGRPAQKGVRPAFLSKSPTKVRKPPHRAASKRRGTSRARKPPILTRSWARRPRPIRTWPNTVAHRSGAMGAAVGRRPGDSEPDDVRGLPGGGRGVFPGF